MDEARMVHEEVRIPRWRTGMIRRFFLQHMAAHLLETSWDKYGQEKPTMPCMLCGVRSAVGQKMEDASQTAGCPIYLCEGSTKKIQKPGHQCKLVGSPEYSLKSAATSVLSAPSTNRPVQCAHCSQVVSSYSMAQHYAEKHSSTAMPGALQDAVALGKHERSHTLMLLRKRKLKAADIQCTGGSCCPKAKKAKAS